MYTYIYIYIYLYIHKNMYEHTGLFLYVNALQLLKVPLGTSRDSKQIIHRVTAWQCCSPPATIILGIFCIRPALHSAHKYRHRHIHCTCTSVCCRRMFRCRHSQYITSSVSSAH